jgi:hypothetical protein
MMCRSRRLSVLLASGYLRTEDDYEGRGTGLDLAREDFFIALGCVV